ncbi:MAG: peroxiredoxin, partial [Thermotogaceae bacterium]|nr:peroxiredoxin [Thermotogaceae bacterium]
MLLKGERAVDFSLYGTDLKTYRLSSLFGKKIVL